MRQASDHCFWMQSAIPMPLTWKVHIQSTMPCVRTADRANVELSSSLFWFSSVLMWCKETLMRTQRGPDWQNSSLMHGWGLGKPHHARHIAHEQVRSQEPGRRAPGRLKTASCQSGSFRSGGEDRASKAQTQKGGQPAPSPIARPAAPNLQRWFGHKVLSQCPTERQLSWTICLDIFLPGHLFHIRRGPLCTCHHRSWKNNFRISFLSRMFNKKQPPTK